MTHMPEPVNARKIALAAEYGAKPADVFADGFTEDYFETFRRPIRPAADADRVRIEYAPIESQAVLRYRVFWFEEDRHRASEAITEDWNETIGPDRARELQLLEARMGRTSR